VKILVINTGSSSIKYKLFDMTHEKVLASGLAEKIGDEGANLAHKVITESGEDQERIIEGVIADHREGLRQIADLLVHPEHGVVRDKSEISSVGHRVVHGGETFKAPIIINE
jgi:acetate kinase